MRIKKSRGARRALTAASAGIVLALVFFGLSLRVATTEDPAVPGIALPDLQPVFDALEAHRQGGRPVMFVPRKRRVAVGLGGQQSLSAAENSWFFVRQSATWANSNSALADNLIMALKNAGLLNNTAPSTIATTTVLNGVTFKLKLETNNSCNPTTACQNITSAAYTGTKTFANRFKLWRASDNKDTLEMLFDDINDPSTSNGVLLNYRMAILNSAFSDNEDLIVESYISGAAPNRRQTYSWGQQIWLGGSQAATSTDRGRVVLEEMTIGLKGGGTSSGALCVRIAARTVSQTLGACGTGAFYYALAYGQKTLSNFETTALSGLANGTLATNGQLCGLTSLGFGMFNGGGFLADGLTSSTVSDGFPDPSVNGGYPGVQALFNKINTAPNGAGTFDDLTKATVDGLNATIAFHPASEAPGF